MMIRMVGGWVFLLVPAHPGSPGQRAVKRLLLLLQVKELAEHLNIYVFSVERCPEKKSRNHEDGAVNHWSPSLLVSLLDSLCDPALVSVNHRNSDERASWPLFQNNSAEPVLDSSGQLASDCHFCSSHWPLFSRRLRYLTVDLTDVYRVCSLRITSGMPLTAHLPLLIPDFGTILLMMLLLPHAPQHFVKK